MAKSMANREIVESFYEAVGEKAVVGEDGVKMGDIDHLRRIFADDIEWIHPALGGEFHGADSLINDILLPFFENWELELDFDRYIEDGNTIVVLANYGGVYKPTGRPFSEPTAHVWDVKDGKISRSDSMWIPRRSGDRSKTSRAANEQLGVSRRRSLISIPPER